MANEKTNSFFKIALKTLISEAEHQKLRICPDLQGTRVSSTWNLHFKTTSMFITSTWVPLCRHFKKSLPHPLSDNSISCLSAIITPPRLLSSFLLTIGICSLVPLRVPLTVCSKEQRHLQQSPGSSVSRSHLCRRFPGGGSSKITPREEGRESL